MFHQAAAGLDEALLHAGHGPTADAPREHQAPPKIPKVVSQDTELESNLVRAKAMAG